MTSSLEVEAYSFRFSSVPNLVCSHSCMNLDDYAISEGPNHRTRPKNRPKSTASGCTGAAGPQKGVSPFSQLGQALHDGHVIVDEHDARQRHAGDDDDDGITPALKKKQDVPRGHVELVDAP